MSRAKPAPGERYSSTYRTTRSIQQRYRDLFKQGQPFCSTQTSCSPALPRLSMGHSQELEGARENVPKATERSRTRPRLSMPVMGLIAIVAERVVGGEWVVGGVGIARAGASCWRCELESTAMRSPGRAWRVSAFAGLDWLVHNPKKADNPNPTIVHS